MDGNSKRDLPKWMMTTSSLQNKVYMPELQFNGNILYFNTLGDCASICENILLEYSIANEIILGFDMEWPVSYNSQEDRTSLIQMCDGEERCYLFNVNGMSKLPLAMLHLMTHPKTKLVGLNITSDLWKLGRDFDLPVLPIIKKNAVELRDFANEVLQCSQSWSLAGLVANLLNMNLVKDPFVRKSKWNAQNLSLIQKIYAATDAFASYIVYQQLNKRRKHVEI